MNRVATGVIVGFLFMLVAPFMFAEWEVNALMNISLGSIFLLMPTNATAAFSTWFSLGFHPDGSLFLIFGSVDWLFDPYLREIVWMTIMAWFSTGFLIGLIVKGWKKSTLVAIGVFIAYFAIYLILSVVSGKDLATLFSGSNLVDLFGVLLTGALFSFLGGLSGGALGGPGEE
ncbi:MAG: hypothetical protein RBG13Loki_1090 [Promethearchaeota archaeon CR_4]|nr:MAG: hypothetical protein RBG13Loki_1090 [Candidatus Lokiarchaeota archaeon CR_4]